MQASHCISKDLWIFRTHAWSAACKALAKLKMVRKQIKLIQLSRAGQLHLFMVGVRLGRKGNAQCVSINYQRVLTSSVHALKLLPSALIVLSFWRKKYEVHLPTSTTGTVLRQAPDLLMLTERNRSLKAAELVLLLAMKFKPSPNSPCLYGLSWWCISFLYLDSNI